MQSAEHQRGADQQGSCDGTATAADMRCGAARLLATEPDGEAAMRHAVDRAAGSHRLRLGPAYTARRPGKPDHWPLLGTEQPHIFIPTRKSAELELTDPDVLAPTPVVKDLGPNYGLVGFLQAARQAYTDIPDDPHGDGIGGNDDYIRPHGLRRGRVRGNQSNRPRPRGSENRLGASSTHRPAGPRGHRGRQRHSAWVQQLRRCISQELPGSPGDTASYFDISFGN